MKHLIVISVLIISVPLFAQNKCDVEKAASLKELKKCKQITFLLSAGAGGGSDKITRDLGAELGKFGIPTIIENVPSANGHIAAQNMKNNTDACKFLVTSNSNISLNAFNPMLKPAIDPAETFEPVSLLSTSPFVLAVHKRKDGMEIKDFDALQEKLKQNSLFYASAGFGSFSHILGSQLEHNLLTNGGQVELDSSPDSVRHFDVHVPYVGSSAGSLGMIRGEVSYYFESPTTIYKTYKTRPDDILILGATSEKSIKVVQRDEQGKVKKVQEIPSLSENYPKLKDMVALPYIGILATKKPGQNLFADNAKAMGDVVSCLVKDVKFRQRYEDMGYVIGDGQAESLKKIMSEYAPGQKWEKIYSAALQMEKVQDAAARSAPAEKPRTITHGK